jgi:hypothetical protein
MEDKEMYRPSWKQNEEGIWKAPVPHPNDGGQYEWNEEKLQWDAITSDEDE